MTRKMIIFLRMPIFADVVPGQHVGNIPIYLTQQRVWIHTGQKVAVGQALELCIPDDEQQDKRELLQPRTMTTAENAYRPADGHQQRWDANLCAPTRPQKHCKRDRHIVTKPPTTLAPAVVALPWQPKGWHSLLVKLHKNHGCSRHKYTVGHHHPSKHAVITRHTTAFPNNHIYYGSKFCGHVADEGGLQTVPLPVFRR